ncbi:gp53-like domain-containing protein [Xenorhabdus bovienii]|uniref:gp53-like domain-containing protein n=1 Tax=Xenorhabdus bovienii TaxID=40576 RepID=UPI0023B27AE3|nr:hypothetical protein [Xenorhabdus bovienii]MDE9431348.1 hypothetical protein [Xenorhabdus bovienii]MDE9489214.1 hypothetical protein [Xenorhabdus bovienii]MDE9549120.1 hypothetical protein [Xenorhabdus bovienii]
MIYSDGTTNLVSGSAIVRGTGTKWKSNINGIAAGQIISIQSGNTVIQNVIRSVNSDTELVLAFAPSINLNNAKYVISTTVPDTVSDGVRHMVAINAYIIQFLQNMDRWMSENGKVEVEMPNGQKVTLDSIRALQAAMEGKQERGDYATNAALNTRLEKSQDGADIPNKPAFVKNLGLSELVYRTIGNGSNQIPDMSFFGGGQGWFKIPDGRMIQYGYTRSDPSGPKIINFLTPFSQECFGVTSSGTDPDAVNIGGCGVIDRFGFYLSAWHVGAGTLNRTATHISWIAVGI